MMEKLQKITLLMKAKFIYEAFEEKNREQKKDTMLYPELLDIKNPIHLFQSLKAGLKIESVPKWKIEEIVKTINTPYELDMALKCGINESDIPQLEEIISELHKFDYDIKRYNADLYWDIQFYNKIFKNNSSVSSSLTLFYSDYATLKPFNITKFEDVNKELINFVNHIQFSAGDGTYYRLYLYKTQNYKNLFKKNLDNISRDILFCDFYFTYPDNFASDLNKKSGAKLSLENIKKLKSVMNYPTVTVIGLMSLQYPGIPLKEVFKRWAEDNIL